MKELMEIFTKEGQTLEGAMESFRTDFPKFAIPKEQYNKKVEELDGAKTELQSANDQLQETAGKIEALTGLAEGNEELKTSLTTLQGEYTEYKDGETTRLTNVQKRHKAELLLGDNKANKDSIDLLVGQLDFDKMTLLESGDLDGFDSQLGSLKESRPTLFATTTTEDPNGKPPTGGNPNADTGKPWWAGNENK